MYYYHSTCQLKTFFTEALKMHTRQAQEAQLGMTDWLIDFCLCSRKRKVGNRYSSPCFWKPYSLVCTEAISCLQLTTWSCLSIHLSLCSCLIGVSPSVSALREVLQSMCNVVIFRQQLFVYASDSHKSSGCCLHANPCTHLCRKLCQQILLIRLDVAGALECYSAALCWWQSASSCQLWFLNVHTVLVFFVAFSRWTKTS